MRRSLIEGLLRFWSLPPPPEDRNRLYTASAFRNRPACSADAHEVLSPLCADARAAPGHGPFTVGDGAYYPEERVARETGWNFLGGGLVRLQGAWRNVGEGHMRCTPAPRKRIYMASQTGSNLQLSISSMFEAAVGVRRKKFADGLTR